MNFGRDTQSGNYKVRFKRATNKTQRIWAILRIVFLVSLIIWLVWSQKNMVLTKDYIYTAQGVPKTFTGFTVVSISDMHNSSLNISMQVKGCKPDVILVSGGLTDDNGNFDKSVKTINKLSNIAPTYYVLGDKDQENSDEITAKIDGAELIEGKAVTINAPEVDESAFINKYIGSKLMSDAKDGDKEAIEYIEYTREKLREDADSSLMISGISFDENENILVDKIYEGIGTDKEVFQVCVANQSKLFNTISKADIDILVAGGTHGFKDEQGKYSKGIYTNSGTTMFLSGGIGNTDDYKSRIFNFPEITSITLSDGTIKLENPIEKLLGHIMPSVSTKFDGDDGFKEHQYTYSYGKEN